MCSVAEMMRRLQSLNNINVLEDMVYVHIKANENILTNLKENEFKKGDINSDDTAWQYSKKFTTGDNETAGYDLYIDYKHALNRVAGYGRIDLINKGRFINSFIIPKPNGNKYLFGATDPKLGMLEDVYGMVRGLRQETFNEFQIGVIKEPFIQDLRKIINKK